MNFISPPTDNLYKFMAIFGLVMAIAVGIYSSQYGSDWRKPYWDLQVQKATLRVDKKYLIEEIKILELKKPKTPKDRELLRIKKWNLQKREAILAVNEEQSAYAEKRKNHIQLAAFFLLAVATIISYMGFRLWYDRIQKHLDKTAKWEADNPQHRD